LSDAPATAREGGPQPAPAHAGEETPTSGIIARDPAPAQSRRDEERPPNAEAKVESALDAASTQPARPIAVEVTAASEAEAAVPTIEDESAAPITIESEVLPTPEEIDRRRAMVRGFFNDYWSSIEDKPASFAERLDHAESYINERVAAGGEVWRLSAATRKQLGLPPSRGDEPSVRRQ
jgi:hypothetical protein